MRGGTEGGAVPAAHIPTLQFKQSLAAVEAEPPFVIPSDVAPATRRRTAKHSKVIQDYGAQRVIFSADVLFLRRLLCEM